MKYGDDDDSPPLTDQFMREEYRVSQGWQERPSWIHAPTCPNKCAACDRNRHPETKREGK